MALRYSEEGRRKRRHRLIAQGVSVPLVLLSIGIVFTVPARLLLNPATIPYAFAVLILSIWDEESLRLNRGFTLSVILSFPVVTLLKIFFFAWA